MTGNEWRAIRPRRPGPRHQARHRRGAHRPGPATTGSAAGTTSRSTARWATRRWRRSPAWSARSGPTRAFLGRAVRYLTAEDGIRQFLDIGAGIPTANNTHEVAQAIAPDALVCYVDRDPVVFGHARALLASGPHGAHQLPRSRPAGHRADPGRGGQHARPHPAGGRAAERGPPVHPGRGRPGQDRHHAAGRDAAGQLPGAVPARQRPRAASPGRTRPARSAGCWPSRSPGAATSR